MRAVWVQVARGCARINSRPDTAKIGSANRVDVHHARLLAVVGVRKTFRHGLDPSRTSNASGWLLSSFRETGPEHSIIDALASGKIGRIVGCCAGAETSDSKAWVQEKPSFCCGLRILMSIHELQR